MTPTTCTRCGAPLPAVAADHRHPDWCPACAARAAGDIGPAPISESTTGHTMRPGGFGVPVATAAPPPPLVLPSAAQRYVEGAIVGLAAGGLGVLAVWALVAFAGVTRSVVIDAAAVVVGIVVGQAVLIGTRRGGAVPALVAVLAVIVPLVAAQYFVERTLTIDLYGVNLPLWQGFSFAKELVTESVTDHPLRGLGWLLAAVAAALGAGSSKRRALL